MHILYGGHEQVIEQRLPNGDLQFKNLATNQFTALPEQQLIDALFDGNIELLGDAREYTCVQLRQAKTLVSDLTALADDDQRKKEARRRFAYITAMKARSRVKFTGEFLKPIIDEVRPTVGDLERAEYKNLTPEQRKGSKAEPSPASLFRWYTDYEASGEDIRVLVPAFKSQGNGDRKISEDPEKCKAVLKIIDDVINEKYLSMERPSVMECYETIEVRIVRDNNLREEDDKLPVPDPVTIYRIIDKLDPYEVDKARFGKLIADAKHKVNKQGPRPQRPLERTEMDDTKLDMFVIDPERMMPIGRPWLYILIDVFTKMILGFYLSFAPPSYLSVMQCLLHAIRPKTYVKSKYPEIIHTWPTYGIPELIVVDNAKPYYSADFEEACLQLGMTTQYAPPRIPWYKPSVERFFGTQNRRLLHNIPGKTFSNIFERADYDPKKNAVISIDTLEEIIHTWIIDIYHQGKHRGLDDVPARLWEIGIKKFPPALPPKNTELEVLIGHIEWRVISGSGVELFGLYYNDDSLVSVRSSLKKGEQVKVKYDPTDISLIYVYDEKNGRYLPIPAVDQDYTKKLSLWQHNVIRRFARQTVDDYVDIVALCAAKERIQNIVEQSCLAGGISATNIKAARWQGHGQQNYRGKFEDNAPHSDQEHVRGDAEPSGKPPLLHAGSHPSEGISNLGNALSTGDDTVKQEGEIIQPQSVGADTNSKGRRSARTSRGKDKQRKSKQVAKKDASSQDKPAKETTDSSGMNPDQHQPADDSALDTTGWGYDYKLPK